MNDEYDVQRNRASESDIHGNNDKVLSSNATVDVGESNFQPAGSIYTNAAFAFSARTGDMKSDSVASASDYY